MFTAYTKPLREMPAEAPTLSLGTLERQFVDLDCGRVAYLRHGSGHPLLLVHGVPTSCRLWEPLLGVLGEHYDCIVPDLLGLGRSQPAPGAELGSPGQAQMLNQLLDEFGINSTHAVFHDQGGAHGLQFLKAHGERVDAVLFTDCVCFNNWLVPVIDLAMKLGRMGLIPLLARTHVLQTLLGAYSLPHAVTRGRFPNALKEDWFYAMNSGGEALRHWIAYMLAQSPYWTQDTASIVSAWDKPAHVLWAAHDQYLPPSWGVKLAQTFTATQCEVELLPFAGHFWQAEVSQTGAEAIHRFFTSVDGG